MKTLGEYLVVFQFCACAGWILEVLYRSTVSKRLVNPGFLLGPWLPIYGFGGMFVYFLCQTKVANFETFFGFVLFFLISCLVMTVLEGAAGLILLHKFKTRLWDYSDIKFNYMGVICPQFSLIWGAACVGFKFLIFPTLIKLAASVEFITSAAFFSGMWFGIFAVDLCYSFELTSKLKEYAKMQKTVVNIEKLKAEIYDKAKKLRTTSKFHIFCGRHLLRGHIEKIISELREKEILSKFDKDGNSKNKNER